MLWLHELSLRLPVSRSRAVYPLRPTFGPASPPCEVELAWEKGRALALAPQLLERLRCTGSLGSETSLSTCFTDGEIGTCKKKEMNLS